MSSTIYDVAKLAGVSTATVSRVINKTGNVRPKTEEKVHYAMDQLKFTPNALAQSFASNKSSTIGFITSLYGPSRDFYEIDTSLTTYQTELFKGINSLLEKEGLSLLVINSKEKLEDQISAMFNQRKIDGLVIGQLPSDTATFRSLIEAKLPIVYTGHIHHYNKGLHVYAEYNQYLNHVLEHFYNTGHKKVMFVSLRDPEILVKEWEDMGYNYHHNMDVIFLKNPHDKSKLHNAIKVAFSESSVPTGLFSELLTDVQPIMSSLTALQLKVPQDVSLISVEHTLGQGSQFYPSMTNIHVPVVEMGRSAIRLLLDYLQGTIGPDEYDQEVLIHSPLIQRDSSRSL